MSTVRRQDCLSTEITCFGWQGALHSAVVDAIRPFLPQLRSTPNGKRILSKINVKI